MQLLGVFCIYLRAGVFSKVGNRRNTIQKYAQVLIAKETNIKLVIHMPTIAHFDLPADDLERAKKFYEELFGWKFTSVPGMPMPYYLIETKDLKGNDSVGGGMGPRGAPDQKIVNYMGVKSVEDSIAKVKELGGKIVMAKAPVPGWGYLAICTDTEGNTFGLWEEDKKAK